MSERVLRGVFHQGWLGPVQYRGCPEPCVLYDLLWFVGVISEGQYAERGWGGRQVCGFVGGRNHSPTPFRTPSLSEAKRILAKEKLVE